MWDLRFYLDGFLICFKANGQGLLGKKDDRGFKRFWVKIRIRIRVQGLFGEKGLLKN